MSSNEKGKMMNTVTSFLNEHVPAPLLNTAYIRLFGFMKIPLLYYIGPKVITLDDKKSVVKVPLKRRNKNHLGAMYFGVLAAGADCAGGISAMRQIHESGKDISLVFKDFSAEFHKRAEGDVYFTCAMIPEVTELVQKTIRTKERENLLLKIVATCPDKLGDGPVASFTLTLSLKCRD